MDGIFKIPILEQICAIRFKFYYNVHNIVHGGKC
jgi:hypothetical protein